MCSDDNSDFCSHPPDSLNIGVARICQGTNVNVPAQPHRFVFLSIYNVFNNYLRLSILQNSLELGACADVSLSEKSRYAFLDLSVPSLAILFGSVTHNNSFTFRNDYQHIVGAMLILNFIHHHLMLGRFNAL